MPPFTMFAPEGDKGATMGAGLRNYSLVYHFRRVFRDNQAEILRKVVIKDTFRCESRILRESSSRNSLWILTVDRIPHPTVRNFCNGQM